eukprot:5221384-Alexandrium_andersonii.AAC.1
MTLGNSEQAVQTHARSYAVGHSRERVHCVRPLPKHGWERLVPSLQSVRNRIMCRQLCCASGH